MKTTAMTGEELETIFNNLTVAELEELKALLNTNNLDLDGFLREPVSNDTIYSLSNLLWLQEMLLLYIPPFLIGVGILGNGLSFLVLMQDSMQRASIFIYLLLLAIIDTLVLIVGLFPEWLAQITGFQLMNQNNWLCKLSTMAGYTASDISIWLIVAIAIERYIAICRPLDAARLCTKTRARNYCVTLLAVFTTLHLHFFWTVELSSDRSESHFNETGSHVISDSTGNGDHLNQSMSHVIIDNRDNRGYFDDETTTSGPVHVVAPLSLPTCTGSVRHDTFIHVLWPWIDTLIYSLIPFVALVVINGRTVCHRRKELRNEKRNNLRNRAVNKPKLNLMYFVICTAFLITTMPMTIVNLSAYFLNQQTMTQTGRAWFYLIRTIAELVMYSNHSINFFLYCLSGEKFRTNLTALICCKKTRHCSSYERKRAIKKDSSVGLLERSHQSTVSSTTACSYVEHEVYQMVTTV